MVSTYTTNKNIEKPGNNDYIGNWNVPVNADWDIIDKALGSAVSYTLTNSNQTVSTTDAQNQRINLSGTLSANVQLILPSDIGGMWVIVNNCVGAYTVTVTTASSTYIVIPPNGYTTLVYSDGTNIFLADSQSQTVSISANIPLILMLGG